MKIIYPNGSGGICIITPTPEFLSKYPIEQVARKDVPAGQPYLIIQDEDVPSDPTYRDAWTADFTSPDGTGIGPDAWWAEQAGGGA